MLTEEIKTNMCEFKPAGNGITSGYCIELKSTNVIRYIMERFPLK
jgi:hypothetical protein